ncbi:hypothetical protein [Pseudorhizobium marinum]|uniref:hypothetical protein n=1 Tax=Pseudorhizobium marinum TaxID=1496690 RepID=UPI00049673A6|nr:hypothetical protein [Pseudorhizobium marinum]
MTWTNFFITIVIATLLLAPEIKRLYAKNLASAVVAGGLDVLIVSIWLFLLLGGVFRFWGRFYDIEVVHLLANVIIPPAVFGLVRRRYTTTMSLYPALGAFLLLNTGFVFFGLMLAYW